MYLKWVSLCASIFPIVSSLTYLSVGDLCYEAAMENQKLFSKGKKKSGYKAKIILLGLYYI